MMRTHANVFIPLSCTHRTVLVESLPLLVEVPHVHQPVLQLLQSPDLLPFGLPADLDGRLAQHRIPLHRDRNHTALTDGIFILIYICWKKYLKNNRVSPGAAINDYFRY